MSVITPTDEELRQEIIDLLAQRKLSLCEFFEQVNQGKLTKSDEFARDVWAWARFLPEAKEVCLR